MSPGIYYATVPSKTYTPIPITIGTQIWDKRNLDTKHYKDGTPIQYSYTNASATIGAYLWYENTELNGITYGKLYNWHAVNNTTNGGIAPKGWRIPTPADWDTLSTYLGGVSVAGGKLKQTGTSLWLSNNTGATNSSGFTALPGGFLNIITTQFDNINEFAYFRTSNSADIRRLSYNLATISQATSTQFNSFHSVRLIRIIVELTTNATSPTVGATSTSLSTGGTISNLNDYVLQSYGVCYSTSPNPTTSDNTVLGSGTGGIGSFNSTITGLTPNTTYYIKAYVITTNNETFYASSEVTAITTGTSTITTSVISSKTSTSATSGGTITSSAAKTIVQSGICWAVYPATPTIENTRTTDGYFGVAVAPPTTQSCGTGLMTGLLQNTQYNVRAYVTTTDTTYGNQVSFTTNAGDILKASYSLRQTVTSYLGAAIRVRGVISGSTITADVNFNSLKCVDTDSLLVNITGTTTATTLQQFATLASTVWVQTWYDQSGNVKNVNQTTTTRQPTIAVGGALNRAGVLNKVALKFTRANSSWMVSATDNSLAMNNTQVYTVCNSDTPTVTAYGQAAVALNPNNRYLSGVFGVGTGSPSTGAEWIGYGATSATYASALLLTPASAASQLFYSISNATGISSWINNSFRGTYSTTNTASSTSINIGSSGISSIIHFNGSIQEAQIYTPSETPNRQEVSDNIRGYYGIPATI